MAEAETPASKKGPTSKELKQRLLRKAFAQGRGTEMIATINRITQENRKDMPPEHQRLLDAYNRVCEERVMYTLSLQMQGVPENELPPQSRALDRLNLEEKLRGRKGNWTTSHQSPTDKPPTLH